MTRHLLPQRSAMLHPKLQGFCPKLQKAFGGWQPPFPAGRALSHSQTVLTGLICCDSSIAVCAVPCMCEADVMLWLTGRALVTMKTDLCAAMIKEKHDKKNNREKVGMKKSYNVKYNGSTMQSSVHQTKSTESNLCLNHRNSSPLAISS